jgi:uncharacterized protein
MALAAGMAAVLAGAFTQSATGFGFALLSAPVLSVTLGPRTAIPTITVVGLVVSALTLTTERRRLDVLRPEARALVGAAVPGMAAGALLLAHGPVDLLRVLVSLAVLAAVVVQLRGGAAAARARRPGRLAATVAGGLSGALSTSTGISGPPLVFFLLARRADAAETRDTLAVVFLVTGVLTLGALAVFGAVRLPTAGLALVACAAAGQGLGRLALDWMRPRHRAALLIVLCLSAAAGLAPAAQALL